MKRLCERLKKTFSLREKIDLLDQEPRVQKALRGCEEIQKRLPFFSEEEELVIKELAAIGELKRLTLATGLESLFEKLLPVDRLYRDLGGIIGYQCQVNSLLKEKPDREKKGRYHPPPTIDISNKNERTAWAIEKGIEAIPFMAEIYPLGGAADRLHLQDEKTQEPLPAAKLLFAGKTLFERLIRDLSAREHLYFQHFGVQVTIPLAIMTSMDKDNHRHIVEMGEKACWFNRPQESFFLFAQPLVPVVGKTGQWRLSSGQELLVKPSGHGALWKLAQERGVFAWLKSQGKTHALIRQINNPLAGVDYGLLAFSGIGWGEKKKFGFASCPRLVDAAEGVNLLFEKQGKIALTNVEYCDFAKFGIEDVPIAQESPISKYSSNTNLLFVSVAAIEEAIQHSPLPGLLLNMKGKQEGRLESTMQNIADVFVEKKDATLTPKETYATYNHRHKTISTAKRGYLLGGALQETPEQCFYDLLQTHRELFQEVLKVDLPEEKPLVEMLKTHPSCVLAYHPALGPLYSMIQEKIQKGRIEEGSFCELEISSLFMRHFSLRGSLRILAASVMGHLDETGVLRYSDRVGRAVLENVSIENRGVDWELSRPFWKGVYTYAESLDIILEGRSLFRAENVLFRGSHRFIVRDQEEMVIRQSRKGGLLIERKRLLK